MDTMEDAMVHFVAQRLRRPPLSQNVTVYISGARSPGEGELKVVAWVQSIMPRANDTMVICGSDSDLLIQALSFPSVNNLLVLQTGADKLDLVCDINALSHEILKDADWRGSKGIAEFDYSSKSPFPKRPKGQALDPSKRAMLKEILRETRIDFILLFILNGNDYLPR